MCIVESRLTIPRRTSLTVEWCATDDICALRTCSDPFDALELLLFGHWYTILPKEAGAAKEPTFVSKVALLLREKVKNRESKRSSQELNMCVCQSSDYF